MLIVSYIMVNVFIIYRPFFWLQTLSPKKIIVITKPTQTEAVSNLLFSGKIMPHFYNYFGNTISPSYVLQA